MTVWREVQEALYQRWADEWIVAPGPDPEPLTPFKFANETWDPPDAPHVRMRVQQRPSGFATLGSPGNRKMDRRGVVFALLRSPPGNGVGQLSDLAENARAIFENCRLQPHDIRFAACDIGEAAEIEAGRWWGVAVECPFAYEEIK